MRPQLHQVFAVGLMGLVALAGASSSRADAPAPASGARAKIECARVPEPGRVRCEVEVKPPPGAALRWADVVVLRTPPFASPLRARVGPLEASTRETTAWRWAIALAAKGRGAGEIEARVRLVSCAGEACVTSEVDARAPVLVGE